MKNNKKRNLLLSLILAAVCLAFLLYVDKFQHYSMLATVLKKGAIYSLVAVSLNLLNGFTGLFSLGQAGFMMIGAYTYAILTIPVASRAAVYQYFDGGIVQFCLPMVVGLILAGVVPTLFAWLIGLPVLKLKSDYLAIAAAVRQLRQRAVPVHCFRHLHRYYRADHQLYLRSCLQGDSR